MAYEMIVVETHGRVGLIRLDRPKALNALCAQLISEMADAIDRFEADPDIGCMVMTGSEKAFAAGADIKEMKDRDYMDVYCPTLSRSAGSVRQRRGSLLLPPWQALPWAAAAKSR
jgi:enoyl-CoA hydratase/carnithine racemase